MKGIAAIVLALTASATAAPIAVPTSWARDAATSDLKTGDLRERAHDPHASVDAYHAPKADVLLLVARVAAPTAGDPVTASAAVAATLHAYALHAGVVDGQGLPPTVSAAEWRSGVIEDDWQQHDDNEHAQLDGLLHAHTPGDHTIATARVLVAADADHVAGVVAECSARETTPYAAVSTCTTALATLDTELPRATRAWPAAIAPPTSLTHIDNTRPIALGDSIKPTTMAPIILPATETPHRLDRRPMYLGALVLLFALFSWWSRRRRDEVARDARMVRHLDDKDPHD